MAELSKQVENTVGKGEIARHNSFSFPHSVFKRLVSQGRQEVSLCGNGLGLPFHKNIANIFLKSQCSFVHCIIYHLMASYKFYKYLSI